jgi:hypothetical protein
VVLPLVLAHHGLDGACQLRPEAFLFLALLADGLAPDSDGPRHFRSPAGTFGAQPHDTGPGLPPGLELPGELGDNRPLAGSSRASEGFREGHLDRVRQLGKAKRLGRVGEST